MKKGIFAAMVALCLSAVAFAAPPPMQSAVSEPVMAQAVVEASQPVALANEGWGLGVASLQSIQSERLQRTREGWDDLDMPATFVPAVGHMTKESVQGRSRS